MHVLGLGWYFYLDKGAPAFLRIDLVTLARNRTVYVALRYPRGTTFPRIRVESTAWWLTYTRDVMQVATAAEVWSGDGYQYAFDGTHLFLRLDTSYGDRFVRDGAWVGAVDTYQRYEITANCTTDADGFCPVTDMWPAPTAYWTTQ